MSIGARARGFMGFAGAPGDVGATMYELNGAGPGSQLLRGFLYEHGEGLHHLCYLVDDLDAATKEVESRGYKLLQSGRGMGTNGDGGYAYFETESAPGHIV